MLQTLHRNDETVSNHPSHQAFYSLTGAPVGGQINGAARTLHEALGRLEQVIQTRPAAAADEGALRELERENQSLKSKCARLEQENATLKQDQTSLEALLGEQEEKNSAVSKQVLDLSVKLEALVARLARVLEE